MGCRHEVGVCERLGGCREVGGVGSWVSTRGI